MTNKDIKAPVVVLLLTQIITLAAEILLAVRFKTTVTIICAAFVAGITTVSLINAALFLHNK